MWSAAKIIFLKSIESLKNYTDILKLTHFGELRFIFGSVLKCYIWETVFRLQRFVIK